jgi:lambda repressor-like predicted transcriptional regulator
VVVLKHFGTIDKNVACVACAVVANLAKNDEDCIELGQCGGCEAVVAALKAFGTTDNEVAYLGCLAVVWLAKNPDNRAKLGQSGGCEAVVAALKAFGATDNEVAYLGCLTVVWLAENADYRAKLGRSGGRDAIVAALKAFGTSDCRVAREACLAIVRLGTAKELDRAGDLVFQMNTVFTNGRDTRGYTRDDASNSNMEIGRLGGCEAVVAALKAFGASDKEVAERGCLAVRTLASDDENKKRLRAVNCLDVLKKTLDNKNRADAINCLQ